MDAGQAPRGSAPPVRITVGRGRYHVHGRGSTLTSAKESVPAIVNGTPGALYGTWEDPLSILGFTVVHGKIAGLHLVTDRHKLRHMRLICTPAPDRGDPR